MSQNYNDPYFTSDQDIFRQQKEKNNYFLHITLFIVTFVTSVFAGAIWTAGYEDELSITFLLNGLQYAFAIMFFISCHEFGHYFAAMYHRVKATLPYYIPFPPIPFFLNFGTLGAVIRTKSPVTTKKAMFDIGIAGPIAGFIACIIILVYGFLNLPGEEFILAIHPDYFNPDYGNGEMALEFGDTILFSLLRYLLTDSTQFVPPMSEIYHYPFLCVGWFGLFVTAMNMIPVGQLDGGHISYTMFGSKIHTNVSAVSVITLFVLGIIGFLEVSLSLNLGIGWSGWLFWCLILYFVIKIKHPPIYDETPLDDRRRTLGYISFVIFLLSFSPTPFVIQF